MPQTWATVTMLKEPPEVVRDFVAHHVVLGASEVHLYFDDPEDPAIRLVEAVPQVRVVRCTPDHWAGLQGRLPSHEARQKANANHAFGRTACDWIIHLDADEMVHADADIGEILETAGGEAIRLPPFEALAQAGAGRGDRPEYRFRGVLPRGPKGVRIGQAAYGEFAGSLSHGMLSHSAGKFFVRTRDPGLRLSIHGPFRNGARVAAPDIPGMRLLHLHGADWTRWRRHLEYRLSAGAYASALQPRKARSLPQATLFERLARLRDQEGEEGLRRFHRQVCTYGPEKRVLARAGALFEADLWLADKREQVFGGSGGIPPGRWPLAVARPWRSLTLHLMPDRFARERRLARDMDFPDEVAEAFLREVAGKTLWQTDLGPGLGLYALLAARAGAPGSHILAFEPDPVHRNRLAERADAHGFDIVVRAEPAAGQPVGAHRSLRVVHLDAARLSLFRDAWRASAAGADLILVSGSADARRLAIDDLGDPDLSTISTTPDTTLFTRRPTART